MSSFSKNRNAGLDAIRGILSFHVALSHLLLFFEHELRQKVFFRWISPFLLPKEAVLVFFLLSGFVIAANYRKGFSSKGGTFVYFFRRFQRLYGIYLVTLLITFIFKEGWLSPSTIFAQLPSNLILYSNLNGPLPTQPFLGNWPLWSLSYEVIYYLCFPLLLFFGTKNGFKGLTLLLLTIFILNWTLWDLYPDSHFARVFAYSLFWWLGFYLASDQFTTLFPRPKKHLILFLVFLLPLVIRYFRDGLKDFTIILCAIPILAYYICDEKSGARRFKYIWECLGAFFYLLIVVIQLRNRVRENEHLSVILFFDALPILGTTFLLLPRLLKTFLFKTFRKLGDISYALYLIHFAVFSLVYETFKKSGLSFFWAPFFMIVGMTIALLLAWLLEGPLQEAWKAATEKWFKNNFEPTGKLRTSDR
jgi:peptidoglycan/LPS O-acetylase OafA/YrhL